jgi:AcrR family transcriptional regulator
VRADATRNRRVILTAAHQVFAERGVGTSLDVVAERAGVGIATLYRRFPDRGALVRAVVLEALKSIQGAVEVAIDNDAQPVWQLLLAEVGELQLGLLMPVIAARADQTHSSEDAELDREARKTFDLTGKILRAAQQDGSLRPDISGIDIHLLLATVTRPIADVTAAYNREVSRRNLRIVMDGLASVDTTPLPSAVARDEDLAEVAKPGEHGAAGTVPVGEPTGAGGRDGAGL